MRQSEYRPCRATYVEAVWPSGYVAKPTYTGSAIASECMLDSYSAKQNDYGRREQPNLML
jgi:hypothetical protein